MDIGKNFKKARERKGIDQKDAAASLDISPSFLSKIERSVKRPNIELIMKAAELYGVNESFFFNKGELSINDLYTKKNTDFIKDLTSMSPEEISNKYDLSIDGKELTSNEIKGLIAYVRSLRLLEEE